jgi:hypothetical protein
MDKLFDKYAWQARRLPALLTLLPLALCFVAWVPKAEDAVKPLIGIVVGAGVLVLLVQFARDAGKAAEQKLFAAWGGMPSTVMLRHADRRIDSVTKTRYHAALGQLVPGIQMPSPEDEQADPAAADTVYQSCGTYLRSKTRDETKFPLLLAENMTYGFRRNLYGLKPWGIFLALIGAGGCIGKLIVEHQQKAPFSPLSVLCLAGCLVLFLIWVLAINPAWVRQAAEAYALRLLETIDQLAASLNP